MNIRREWILGALFLSLAGCPAAPTQNAPATLPLAGQTVEILAPVDLALREAWDPLLQEWQAQTGAAVSWQEYELHHPPWKEDRRPDPAQPGGRIVIAPLADLATAESAGWLTPFPVHLANHAAAQDVFPGLKEAALSRQRKLVAVPVSVPTLLCYYRRDLLTAAQRTPPETWHEYQQLIASLDDWAPGLTAMEPCAPEFLPTLFLARSAAFAKHPQNYSAWFDIQTGSPLFDSPPFHASLKLAREDWQRMPSDIWTAAPADCRQQLLTGKAAIVLTFEPAAAYPPLSPSVSQDAAAFDIGVAALPGTREVYQRDADRWETLPENRVSQPALVGFTGLVMGVQAAGEQAGAWNLLQAVTQLQDQAFPVGPRSVCRESEALSPPIEAPDLPRAAASLVVDATAESLRRRDVVFDLPMPHADPIRRVMIEVLSTARDESRSVEDILAELQAQVTKATDDQRAALRDHFRRSVGLAPLK